MMRKQLRDFKLTPLVVLVSLLIADKGWAGRKVYDVVIYGGTSAGIAAAVQVKKMGGTVVVVEPTNRIGGLTTGGLGQTSFMEQMEMTS